MGFRDVTCKIGNMRKAKSWTIYPLKNADDKLIKIQCDNRIAQVNLENGETVVSNGKQNTNCFMGLQAALGAKKCTVSDEVINLIKEALSDNQHVGPVRIL